MSSPPLFESEPVLLRAVPRPPVNPRDVAALFDWLDVEPLHYREFQLVDEKDSPGVPSTGVVAGRTSSPAEKRLVLVSRASAS
ncbi:MAG: hypothetical protein ABI164_05620 [Acidobacteriaceae bacterium]